MDYRAFARRLLMKDGTIDAAASALVRRTVMADGHVDRREVEFLLELRRDAKTVHPSFLKFLYSVLKKAVLKDGVVTRSETAWLRKLIFDAGLLAGPQEREFLTAVRREADRVVPEFDALLAECGGPLTPARPVARRKSR
jgi:hypothetical protein